MTNFRYKGSNKKYDWNTMPSVYKGKKNETILPEFVDICRKTQEELKEWLPKKLIESGYTDIVKANGFIYAKGTVPVLLTAHMDTVHKDRMVEFYEREENGRHILYSPQGIGGDDRCGIYMILDIIKTYKCSVLFCEDEEIGCVGSREFCKTELIQELEELNYLIELDRANATDAVFYDCDNQDFAEFILNNTGYTMEWGSFSDISYIAPACKVAAVNLSCGYYHAHTLKEEVVLEEMLNTINVVKNLLSIESEKFEYIEADYYNYGYYGGYNNRYNYYDNDYYYDDYLYNRQSKKTIVLIVCTSVKEDSIIVTGSSKDEVWKKFFIQNPSICYNDVLDFEYYD